MPNENSKADNIEEKSKSYTKKNDQTASGVKLSEERRIGVHCVAGLGRAPFFVAIALVNNGCSPSNAIDLIRKNRPGAFNIVQANYILEFKGQHHRKVKRSGTASCKCSIF